MKSIVQKLTAFALLPGGIVLAEGHHEGLPMDAPVITEIPLWDDHAIPVNNSLIMYSLAVLVLIVILRLATRRMERIPHGLQNFVEWVFETLYNFIEGLAGKRLTKKYFWYFATVFLLILTSNYMGLIPGVGEITYDGQPIFRGANADLNVTLFLGFLYAILWFIWSIREQGIKHFLSHIFGVKGGLTGFLRYALMPIFFFVGLIELLSICVRPVALAARLFGNIYAGEAILEKMGAIGWYAMLPFMCMEVLVGFVQALVFLMLTALFLKTQVGGDEETAH